MKSFHQLARAVQIANRWTWAFSLGYVSGRLDGQMGRDREHDICQCDDYALGYHRGYSDGKTSKHRI